MYIQFFKWKIYLILRFYFFILCVCLFIVLNILGIWQLHRYDYKKYLLKIYKERMQLPLKMFSYVLQNDHDLAFLQVKVRGKFINDKTILIQNKIKNHELGYEIMTPIQIPNEDRLLLVDRGWVKMQRAGEIPKIALGKPEANIRGYIKYLNEYQFILGKNILNRNQFPLIVQKINFAEFASIYHQNFFPFIVRLQMTGAEESWTNEIGLITPARHLGYAIQWFSLSVVLLIAFLCFSIERVEGA